MRWEQAEELNHYILGEPAQFREAKRQSRRIILPLLVMMAVGYLEMILISSWAQERSASETVILSVVGTLALGILLVGTAGAGSALLRTSKRSVETTNLNVRFSPAKRGRRPWKSIAGVHYEPVPGLPGAAKVIFQFRVGHRQQPGGQWSMVLASEEQQQTLLNELRGHRDQHRLDLTISHHPEPLPATPMRFQSTRGMWIAVLGYWLLLHGMPLLAFGLAKPLEGNTDSSQEFKMTPKRELQLYDFLEKHPTTPQEFKWLMVILGAGLTLPGALLVIHGFRMLPHSDSEPILWYKHTLVNDLPARAAASLLLPLKKEAV